MSWIRCRDLLRYPRTSKRLRRTAQRCPTVFLSPVCATSLPCRPARTPAGQYAREPTESCKRRELGSQGPPTTSPLPQRLSSAVAKRPVEECLPQFWDSSFLSCLLLLMLKTATSLLTQA